MANQGVQQNPGGQPYSVVNDNQFDAASDTVQQCADLDSAWKAITSIRPKQSGADSPLTAQPIHDVFSYILTQLEGRNHRRGALHFPGLWPSAPSYLGKTAAAGANSHIHYVYEGGRWIPSTGAFVATSQQAYHPGGAAAAGVMSTSMSSQTDLSHTHDIDFGQCPSYLPVFFSSFSPVLPADGFIRGAYQSQKLAIEFHYNQGSLFSTSNDGILSGVDITNGRAVMIAISNAIQAAGHQVWSGDFSAVGASRETSQVSPTNPASGLAWLGSGAGSLTSDVFGLGKMYYWGLTYEAHLTWWLMRAYFPSLVNCYPNQRPPSPPSFDISPYGINYWPGDMSKYVPLMAMGEEGSIVDPKKDSREFDLCDVAARWMGRDPNFNFDEFVKTQIWGADNATYTPEQKAQYYGEYLLAMDNYLKYGNPAKSDLLPPAVKYWKKFTADGRCHPTRCITPLHVGYTLDYVS